MRCPICKQELEVTGQARLETLGEHVCDPNGIPSMKDKYQCPNEFCIAKQDELMWNEDGEYYSGKNFGKKYEFIDFNSASLGSFQRRINVEVCKHDEDFTLLNLYYVKLMIEFKYIADEDGNVLKRYPQIRVLKRHENGWIFGKLFFKYHRKW